MKKKELYKEVNKLTKDQEEKLKKKFPKIPKKKITKEQIQLRQAKRKARCENICIFLTTIFFLCIAIAGIYVLYLELKHGYC